MSIEFRFSEKACSLIEDPLPDGRGWSVKIVSRLLAHELHAQNGPRVTLSRDEVLEIQTAVDLFIEEILRSSRTSGGHVAPTSELEVQAVPARVN